MDKSISKKLELAGFTMIEIMAIQSSILFTVESDSDKTDNFKRLFGSLVWESLNGLRHEIID